MLISAGGRRFERTASVGDEVEHATIAVVGRGISSWTCVPDGFGQLAAHKRNSEFVPSESTAVRIAVLRDQRAKSLA